MNHTKLTWDQVTAIKHWNDCDLGQHTIAQCRADVQHKHAIDWGVEAVSIFAVIALAGVAMQPLRRLWTGSRARAQPTVAR